MTATPTWFGPDDQPLLGWMHAPSDGRVHAGVVICPPLGKEHISAYRTLRILAERLSNRGLAAFRFDYEGTGDSSGDLNGPSKVDRWLENITSAVNLLRSAGVDSVALVGLRMGATLAARAARRCAPLTSLVCWDPCESGAGFLREQRALFRFSVARSTDATPSEGAVEAPGVVYGRETVEALKSVRLDLDAVSEVFERCSGAGQRPLFVLTRKGGPTDAAPFASETVKIMSAPGQEDLLDVPSYDARTPVQALNLIVDHLVDALIGTDPPTVLNFEPQRTAIISREGAVGDVVESIEWFGPKRLFGIITTPRHRCGAPLLCLNVATEHHIGPARLWVDLARRLALVGHTTVRFDYLGVGDSVDSGDPSAEPRTYCADTWSGVLDVARDLTQSDRGVAYLGLCSGAWAAARAALELPPRAVYLINPATWQREPAMLDGAALAASDSEITMSDTILLGARQRVHGRVKRVLPLWLYRVLGAAGVMQVPDLLLRPLVRSGTRVTLIFGAEDSDLFERQRGNAIVQRLEGRGPIRLRHMQEVDHSLLRHRGRELVMKELIEAVRADLADAADVLTPTSVATLDLATRD